MTEATRRARAVAIEVAAVHAASVDRDARFPRETIEALRAERLLGARVPTERGGEGLPLRDIASVCHELGQRCASSAMIYAMHQIQVACIVRHAGDSAWHAAFMERLAGDQLLLASATSEAGVGGDVRSSVCAVAREGEAIALEKNATVIS